MSGAIATAVVASAVVGAGVSLYTAEQQKDAAADDRRAREAEAEAERKRLADIAANTKPQEQSAIGVDYGATGTTGAMSSASDFLVKKQSGGLSSTGRSGLGFTV